MFKKISIIITSLLLNSFSFAKTSSIRIEPFFALRFLNINEVQYDDIKESQKRSLLEWNENCIPVIGTNFDFLINKSLLRTSISLSLPNNNGTMKDFDWTPNKTNFCYSIHDNSIDTSFSFNSNYNYEVLRFKHLIFMPSLIFSYDFLSMKARNGYGWYGLPQYTSDNNLHDWKDSESKYFEKGKLNGINFTQHTFSTFLGADFILSITNKTFLSLHPQCAIVTFNYFDDYHLSKTSGYHTTSLQYDFFKRLKFNFKLSHSIKEYIDISIGFSLLYGSYIKGDRYRSNEYTPYKAGSSVLDYSPSLLISFKVK